MTEPADKYDFLPGVLAEIAKVAGLDAALGLAQARGGTRVHIPGRAAKGHWLVQAVGQEAANQICDHFAAGMRQGGMKVDIPLGPTGTSARMNRAMDRMLAEGKSSSTIARALGTSGRTVFRRKAKMRDRLDGPQPDLFENVDPDTCQG